MSDTPQNSGPEAWLSQLADILAARRATVSQSGDALKVRFGRSFTAAEATIDPSALWPVLEDAAPAARPRLMQGFASGVHHVLLEPRRSHAEEWSYAEAAASLTPTLEVWTFRLGAEAAGSTPWTTEFGEDLIIAYIMDLNIGRRVLTAAQVERWGASQARIEAAARSILYHKTWGATPKPVAAFEPVKAVQMGDDYDAIRSIVVFDFFFGDFKDNFRISMPSPEALLFVEGDAPEQLEALRAATDQFAEAADYPLSRSLYTFRRGQPVLDEARSNP